MKENTLKSQLLIQWYLYDTIERLFVMISCSHNHKRLLDKQIFRSEDQSVKSCVKSVCIFPTDVNSAVSYSLLPGPGYELFMINCHTGEISTSTRLDREIQSSFTLRGEIYHLSASSPPLIPIYSTAALSSLQKSSTKIMHRPLFTSFNMLVLNGAVFLTVHYLFSFRA